MLKPSLQLRIGQQLTMTPQLQQAIRLLQLPSLDLQAHVRETLETNVMLEAEEELADAVGEPVRERDEPPPPKKSMPSWTATTRRASSARNPRLRLPTKPGASRPADRRIPAGRAMMTAAAISAISTVRPCKNN